MKAKITLFTTLLIFLFGSITLASVTQLTHNAYDEHAPQIHQGQVTWYGWDGYDGQDYEIFLYAPDALTVDITLKPRHFPYRRYPNCYCPCH